MATSAGAVYVDVKANTTPFEKSMGGLGDIAKGIGGKIAAALSVAAIAKFSKSCLDLASDLNEVQNVVDVTFSHMGAQMDEWARGATDSFGLSETMAKRYAGTFGSMAEAFGFTEQQAYDMSTALTGLAGDVASFYNISQDAAYTKLKSVFSGETESLKELGVVMTQTALNEYALANGYGKTVDAMTEQEKVGLRLAFVQNALSNATGDFARTSGSWANQVRLLSLRWEQFRATIGQSLIAALLPVVRCLNAIILAATNAARALNRMVEALTGRSMAELTGGAQQVGVDLSNVADSSADAAGSGTDLANAQRDAAKAAKAQDKAQRQLNRTLAGFDRINKLASENAGTASTPTGSNALSGLDVLGDSGLAGLGDTAAAEAGKVNDALASITLPSSLRESIERLKGSVSDLADTITGGLKWAWDNVLVPLGEFSLDTILPDTINLTADAIGHLNDFLGDIADPLERFVTMCRDGLMWAWENVLEPVANWTVNEAAPRALDGLSTAFDILVTCLEKLQPVAQFLWDNIVQPVGEYLGDKFLWALDKVNDALEWLLGQVSQADFSEFLGYMEPVADFLVNEFKRAFDSVGDAASWVWNDVLKPFGNFLGNAFTTATETASGVTASLKDTWDGFTSKTVELAANVAGTVSGAWDTAKDAFLGAGDWLRDRSASVTATVAATVSNAWESAKGAFTWVKNNAKAFVTTKARKITATVKASVSRAWESARDAFTFAKRGGLNLAKKVANSKLTAAVKSTFEGSKVWGSVKSAFGWVMANKDTFKSKAAQISATVRTALGRGWESVRGLWSWAWSSGSFRDKAARLTATVSTFASNAWATMKNAFSWASQHMRNITATISLKLDGALMNVKGAVNNVIAWINSKLNGLKWPTLRIGNAVVGGGNIFPWNPVPYLAQGGWVPRNTPQLAIVGDNRREGEIIAPESKMQAMADQAARNGGDASTLLPVLNSILAELRALDTGTYLDGHAITRRVVSNINAQTRATGHSPILV